MSSPKVLSERLQWMADNLSGFKEELDAVNEAERRALTKVASLASRAYPPKQLDFWPELTNPGVVSYARMGGGRSPQPHVAKLPTVQGKQWDIFDSTRWLATRFARSAKSAIAQLRREAARGEIVNLPNIPLSASPAMTGAAEATSERFGAGPQRSEDRRRSASRRVTPTVTTGRNGIASRGGA